MESLRILSLGRNLIKKIENLDAVADTLEELWISYNQIASLVRPPVVPGAFIRVKTGPASQAGSGLRRREKESGVGGKGQVVPAGEHRSCAGDPEGSA